MRLPTALVTLGICSLLLLAGCDRGSNPISPSTAPLPAPVPTPQPGSSALSFRQDVVPILDHYGCTSCHGGSGGLFLGTVAQMKQGGFHGPAIIPGNGAGSNIVEKISAASPFGSRMPQGGPFLPDSLQLVIRTWIDQGAADN